jgi:dTDP-4-dehydrorhamnose reductase
VVNAVALVGYDVCERDPTNAFRVNALPASFMARACQARGITFVQLSTHAVFDGHKQSAYTEEDTPNPLNGYAATKYLGELYARNLCARHYVVRLPTLFGPRRNHRPGFVDKVLERIGRGEELRIATDKIDSPTYSRDAADRLLSLVKDQRQYGTYHLANAGSVSYFDFVVEIAKGLGTAVRLVPAKDRDFPFVGLKPLRTAMTSVRLPPLRTWQDATLDFLRNDVTS